VYHFTPNKGVRKCAYSLIQPLVVVPRLANRSATIARMNRRTVLGVAPLAMLVPGGMAEAMKKAMDSVARQQVAGESSAVYELRIYHAAPGKLDALVARFRDHTMKLFANHGMKSVAYWTALDEPAKSSTFFYILEHPSREAAAADWKAFQNDPEWQQVKAKSEENGKLVEKIDSTFLTLTDFSPRLG
jgi:NIPSNAP